MQNISIEANFKEFIDKTKPGFAMLPEKEQKDIKTTFFAGAASTFNTITSDIASMSDEDANQALNNLNSEISKFVTEKIKESMMQEGNANQLVMAILDTIESIKEERRAKQAEGNT